jgi:hypothetical protein
MAQNNLYIELDKVVNGSWVIGMPVLEYQLQQTPFLLDWESRLNFTIPRGGKIPNHHSAQTSINVGINIPLTYQGNPSKNKVLSSAFFTFGLGLRQYYAGNDDGIPAGVESFNIFRGGITF